MILKFLIFLQLFILTSGFSVAQKKKISSDTLQVNKRSNDSTISKDKHPQDSPENSGFFITSKNKLSAIRILGSVRVFGAYDFNGLQGKTSFAISNIPVGNQNKNEKTYFLTANISRLGLEAIHKKTFIGRVFVKVEADFNGNGNQFRIRHAYGQSKHFVIGQTWTGFSDIETLPNTVDLEGPPTAVSLRTVQIKYLLDFNPGWRFRVCAESPSVSTDIPDSISVEDVTQKYPAFTANLKKDWKALSIKLAGIINPISVRSLSGERNGLLGAGGLLSAKIKLAEYSEFLIQALYGSGIISYMNFSENSAYDVIFNPNDSNYELTTSWGGFVCLQQYFLKKFVNANIVFGLTHLKMQDYYADNTFKDGLYAAANLFFVYSGGFRIGAEYNYGKKVVKNGDNGNANRFAFTFYYDF